MIALDQKRRPERSVRMSGKSRDPVIADVEMLHSARMATMRKLRRSVGRRDEWLLWVAPFLAVGDNCTLAHSMPVE